MSHPQGLRALAARSAAVFLIRVAGAGLGFLFTLLLARKLGAHGSGLYALALTTMTVASVFIRLGFDTALLKFAAASIARQQGHSLVSLERRVMAAVAACGTLVSAIGYFGADAIAQDIFGNTELAEPLRMMSLALIPFALMNLYGELLKSGSRFALSALVQGTALPALTTAAIIYFGNALVSPGQAGGIFLGASLVVLGFAVLAWRIVARRFTAGTSVRVPFAEFLATALPLYGGSIAGIVMTWSDLLLLGHWAASSEVGIYNAAARTGLLTSFVLMAINTIVAPRFSSLASTGDAAEMGFLARRAALLSTVATLPLIATFAIWGEQILSLFGPQFSAGWAALVIIGLGQLVNAFTGPVGYLLTMSGNQRVEGWISMAAAGTNILASVLLIPAFGIVGAAIANALAISACNVARVYFAYRLTGILVLPLLRGLARPASLFR